MKEKTLPEQLPALPVMVGQTSEHMLTEKLSNLQTALHMKDWKNSATRSKILCQSLGFIILYLRITLKQHRWAQSLEITNRRKMN